MGNGGGRRELARHMSGGAISSPGFSPTYELPPNPRETTAAIDEVLDDHLDSIRPSRAEEKLLGEMKDWVASTLSSELTLEQVNVVGSVAKRTQNRRKAGNDIDVVFILNEKVHGNWLTQENGPRNCLSKVRDALASRLRMSDIKTDRNTVTGRVGDKKIDVIPAFRHPEGGIWIPDTSGRQKWIRTNPRLSKRLLEERDRQWNGQVTKIIRLAKDLNEKNGGILTSTHIEATVTAHLDTRPSGAEKSLRASFHEYVARLPWLLQRPAYEEVYHQRVDEYLTPKERDRAIAWARRAASKVERAEKIARRGLPDQAADAYQEVLE